MVQVLRRSSLLGFLLTTVGVPALYAAEPVSLQHTPFSTVKRLFSPKVPGLLKAGSLSDDELQLIQQHQDRKHVTHARMQQYYSGFPVFGGYAILHGTQTANQMWGSNKQPVSMNGVVYQGLSDDLGQPASDFVVRGKDALNHFKSQFAGQQLSEEKVRPIIYIDADNRAHWAYEVSILVSYDAKIPERPTAIIDAQTYQSFVKWNNVKKVAKSKVAGRGYGGNVHAGVHQFGDDYPLLQLTRNDQTGICYMENAHVKVVDMMHRYIGRNQAMHFLCPDNVRQSDGSFLTGYKGDGYDKVNGAYSPSNDALYAGNIIYDMYKNWYGVSALEENGKEKSLIMRVHFGMQYDNAFWDGQQMTFGDGGRSFYPMVSLGVSAHEISHGFTERHSDLAYFGQSGGMNESFSDMASQAAEFYASGTNSWTIGAEIVKESSGMKVFRYMDVPSRDGASIDSADQYLPEMDVHHTSGVYNRLFYLLATQPGWDVRRAFEVMATANMDYWTPTSTFDEGACGIIDAAKSFNYSIDDIKRALDQVNVSYSECYDESNSVV